jgi:predicted phage terminase large subunit-like protein
MPLSPSKVYAEIVRRDFCAFLHRSFIELNPATRFLWNWHLELLATKLESVRAGRCKRLIINLPPRHLKSHITSTAFPAWLLGHEPAKRILVVTYGHNLSDNFARSCRSLMQSAFYRSLFTTRLSEGREALSDYETDQGGYRLSTSVGGALTGRGADIIIVDDPLKADDALSDTRRSAVNAWFDNTLRSRLNSLETGAVIIVMQRLHADDLIAHVQEGEAWEVLSFPALAEHDECYDILTPYGRKRVGRRAGEALHPAHLSAAQLEQQRRVMTDYNFTAQYQQNPQPPSGVIVKRDWLKFYTLHDKPQQFDQIIQSWDTANKDTELANFSVCTTWGRVGQRMYLLDVFRKKLDFPGLKRAVLEQARAYPSSTVLIEDKASGTSLLQELRAEYFSRAEAAPSLDGDKVMRLRGQTAKIENGLVLFPKEARWLDNYLAELLAFPNSKHDDQVDSTVFALAWVTQHGVEPGILTYYRRLVEDQGRSAGEKKHRVWVPPPASNYQSITGRMINIPDDRIIEVTQEELKPILQIGARRIDIEPS